MAHNNPATASQPFIDNRVLAEFPNQYPQTTQDSNSSPLPPPISNAPLPDTLPPPYSPPESTNNPSINFTDLNSGDVHFHTRQPEPSGMPLVITQQPVTKNSSETKKRRQYNNNCGTSGDDDCLFFICCFYCCSGNDDNDHDCCDCDCCEDCGECCDACGECGDCGDC